MGATINNESAAIETNTSYAGNFGVGPFANQVQIDVCTVCKDNSVLLKIKFHLLLINKYNKPYIDDFSVVLQLWNTY